MGAACAEIAERARNNAERFASDVVLERFSEVIERLGAAAPPATPAG